MSETQINQEMSGRRLVRESRNWSRALTLLEGTAVGTAFLGVLAAMGRFYSQLSGKADRAELKELVKKMDYHYEASAKARAKQYEKLDEIVKAHHAFQLNVVGKIASLEANQARE